MFQNYAKFPWSQFSKKSSVYQVNFQSVNFPEIKKKKVPSLTFGFLLDSTGFLQITPCDVANGAGGRKQRAYSWSSKEFLN